MDKELFKKGMSKLAGGVTLISTGSGEMRRGITATAVCSLSDSPPSLIACANKSTGTGKSIYESKKFAVNVLGDEHKDLAMVFAGATGLQGVDRFEHGNWIDHESGVPYVADAMASFICEVSVTLPFGNHYAFAGRVVDIILPEQGAEPVVWMGSSFQRLIAV